MTDGSSEAGAPIRPGGATATPGGTEGAGPATARRAGLDRMIGSNTVSYGRLPMLEVVLDRHVRALSTSLRSLTSNNVEVSIAGLSSLRFGDYLDAVPAPSMIGVFRAEPWDGCGLVVVDTPMVYSTVEVLLGGGRGAVPSRIENRSYTTIERDLAQRLVRILLLDLAASFEPLSPVRFDLERLETNPRFAAVSRASNAAVAAKLRIDMDGRGGAIDLVLPFAMLEPIRELLVQQFMGEKLGQDRMWEAHLAGELRQTSIELEAVLDEVALPLSEVMALEPGSRIVLSVSPGATVRLRCGGVHLFDAEMGNRRRRVAVRIVDAPAGRHPPPPGGTPPSLDAHARPAPAGGVS